MEERTKEEISGGKKDEEELLQAYLRGLEKAQGRGLTLPPTIVTPVTPSQESSEPVPATSTQPPASVTKKKKRKAEDQPEKPAETVTTVAEKDVPPPSGKLTAKTLTAMSEEEIEKLAYSDVSHIKWEEVMAIRPLPPTAIRNAIRPLLVSSVREQQTQEKAARQTFDEMLKAFNAVKKNIQKSGDWYKHYQGKSAAQQRFTDFLDRKGYTPRTLIERVIGSSRVAKGQYCTFERSDRSDEICEVTIDLGALFDDDRMNRITIGAGITEHSLEVFHVGPRR
jgi:hypothetical protein